MEVASTPMITCRRRSERRDRGCDKPSYHFDVLCVCSSHWTIDIQYIQCPCRFFTLEMYKLCSQKLPRHRDNTSQKRRKEIRQCNVMPTYRRREAQYPGMHQPWSCTPQTDQIDHDLDHLYPNLPLWDVVQDLYLNRSIQMQPRKHALDRVP